MGLFRRKQPQPTEEKPLPFRIELGWRGMFGVVVVCFCLFLWMFLLGIWAGQTILLPPKANQTVQMPVPSPPSADAGEKEKNTPRRPQSAVAQ